MTAPVFTMAPAPMRASAFTDACAMITVPGPTVADGETTADG